MSALCIVLVTLLWWMPAHAADVSLSFSWDKNIESDLAGYRLYRSSVSGKYTTPIATIPADLNTYATTVPQTNVDATYFHVLTAFDKTGNESGKSNELSILVRAAPAIVTQVALSLTTQSSTELIASWKLIDPLLKIDLRVMPAPISWGSAQSVACPSFPCTVGGLAPGTTYEAQAVTYSGIPNVNAVFGKLSAIASASTLPAPIVFHGMTIQSQRNTQIVITAPIADCPQIITSTNGSMSALPSSTLTCADASGNEMVWP